VWGGGGAGTVAHAKESIATLLQEYVENRDAAEAARCLGALKLPFFHHELVKRACTMAVEQDNAAAPLLDLLQQLAQSGLVTSDQLQKGFDRMCHYVHDLSLDVPGAQGKFATIVQDAKKRGLKLGAESATLVAAC